MKKKISRKTSVNIKRGLANAYGGCGCEMKKAVLEIRPEYLGDPALRKLFAKYKITVSRGEKHLWQNKKYFDELFTLLFPYPFDRTKSDKVSLHLGADQITTIHTLSGEETLTEGFSWLLLLHHAIRQQDNISQVNANAANFYKHILKLATIPAHTAPSRHTPASTPKKPSDTGLKVLGNKKWFLDNFEEIIQALPNSVDTFVESCTGSGIVAFEACKQKRFKRIITNDIYWHKSNYLRAFFLASDALKAACLSLRPDRSTYDEANKVIEKYKDYSTDEILPDVAARYLFINYCNNSRGRLNPNNILEGNEGATEKYIKYLDSLWNSYRSGKKVIIHNEDASVTIKKHNRKKHLLFVDPPYPETKGYENKFSSENFGEIAKDTIAFNGYFIFCCRITKKHGKIHEHDGAYGMDDLHIKHIIDNSFLGHGLYFRDYPYNKSGVAIERVITNFPFPGCSHYDTGQPWQGE